MVLIQLTGRIQNPIANAVKMVFEIYGVFVSAECLQEVVGLPDEEQNIQLKSFDEIRLEKVNFQYEESLEDVLTALDGYSAPYSTLE